MQGHPVRCYYYRYFSQHFRLLVHLELVLLTTRDQHLKNLPAYYVWPCKYHSKLRMRVDPTILTYFITDDSNSSFNRSSAV